MVINSKSPKDIAREYEKLTMLRGKVIIAEN